MAGSTSSIDRNIYKYQIHEVKNVSTYIEKIQYLIEKRKKSGDICLFRGESSTYDTACRANIFRKGVIQDNKLFEKSLFDSMRQNKLTNDNSYLENAIDAQHGEFPSRLLDVTYNCLNALYFAVTPYYHKDEDTLDSQTGMVYIFFIDEIFSPSGKNTNDNYNAIINRDVCWFNDSIIFEKNHKFIDHTKLNNRIVAQQGAFILFQGNDASNLPAHLTYGIKIPGVYKKKIREELKSLFGIHTGSIYPEIVNLVSEISEKSKLLSTDQFNCENELKLVVKNLNKELRYYLDYIIDLHIEAEKLCDQVILIEKLINSYKVGIVDFVERLKSIENFDATGLRKLLPSVIREYNKSVEQFSVQLRIHTGEEISLDGLCIKLVGGNYDELVN